MNPNPFTKYQFITKVYDNNRISVNNYFVGIFRSQCIKCIIELFTLLIYIFNYFVEIFNALICMYLMNI